MRLFKLIFTATITTLLFSSHTNAQCNTNTNICSTGISGPFTFTSPGTPVSSCLDFYGPGYAYISLYITQSGPLELLIEGDATSGFLDVSIFNVPNGSDPCTAILDQANEISCNYASNAGGCNQIGTYFSCSSSVPSPNVSAGDRLMIVVENWSGASSNFTLQLAPAPAAQTGPADPTISAPTVTLTPGSPAYQMLAADNGGTWSGPGITSGGMFDPAITGSGTFTITYDIGTGICASTDSYQLVVESPLAVEMKDISLECINDAGLVTWETMAEVNCDYFRIEKSRDGKNYQTVGTVEGHGTSPLGHQYSYMDEAKDGFNYYRLIEVDYNGTNTVYSPFYSSCKRTNLLVFPNPAKKNVTVQYNGFHQTNTTITCLDQTGRPVKVLKGAPVGQTTIPIEELSSGVYTLIIEDSFQLETARFSKL